MKEKRKIETGDIRSEFFPRMLREIEKCPEKLYCIGNLELLNRRSIAVVGSRKTTQYGRNTAREIALKLSSRGITVVSGMAAGIDTCAHEGAVNQRGGTVAVLGCGPDVCYPSINARLKEIIEAKGLIVSEFPPGTGVEKYHFPMRNRIISGLSEGTVVVQAGASSGAIITAELAVDQQRDVYAVPGNIDSQYNLGSNKLIRDGAIPVLTTGDLLDQLGVGVIDEEEAALILSDSERQVYKLLMERGELSADQLCMFTGFRPSEMAKLLTVMELKGIVFSSMGKIFVAKN